MLLAIYFPAPKVYLLSLFLVIDDELIRLVLFALPPFDFLLYAPTPLIVIFGYDKSTFTLTRHLSSLKLGAHGSGFSIYSAPIFLFPALSLI